MCPLFNLVFEETPHEFLFQERKNKLAGRGVCQRELIRLRMSEGSEDRNRELFTLDCWIHAVRLCYLAYCFPRSGHVPTPSTVPLCFMYRPLRQSFSLALPFNSFPPLFFTLLPSPLPPSTSRFTCASESMHSVSFHTLFSCAASALAPISLPSSL